LRVAWGGCFGICAEVGIGVDLGVKLGSGL